MICRSVTEVRAAALADARGGEPLSQDQADTVAAIWQSIHTGKGAAA